MSDYRGLVPMSAELTMFFHEFESSLAIAAFDERQRIIKLWDEEMSCGCESPMPHLLERIKGNNE